MADLLIFLQDLLDAAGLLILITWRHWRRGFGLYTLGSLTGLVGDVLDGSRGWAYVDSTMLAVYGWAWWNSGGGDGTKRRLRRWVRRFRGVRRTAPVMGAA